MSLIQLLARPIVRSVVRGIVLTLATELGAIALQRYRERRAARPREAGGNGYGDYYPGDEPVARGPDYLDQEVSQSSWAETQSPAREAAR